MLVTPPRTPSRATGEIERLLEELGYMPLSHLDEERGALAETHEELFEEVSAFARRGWAYSFDAETGTDYDPEVYTRVLAEIVGHTGIRKVTFNDVARTVAFDARTFHVPAPDQDDDWLDIAWIMDVTERALEGTVWRLVELDDTDPHCVITGVVPAEVWIALEARGVQGSWRAIGPAQEALN